ncbi:B3 domain-containing protein REM8-like [Beta vulgaris subsp. vulgaris]|uniref:B3 domain-containing protein REM8-like n=1 Tax=Beta vulgaris subsp. vulgaris TaxID=3555 RepID=UPI002547B1B5|nr:B3 domain-containing protein REM8-like [Beta vulgaris subsp. vulgaris]
MVVWVTNVLVVNCFIMQSIPKSFLYYLRDELELEDDNEKAVILRDKRGQSWVIKLDNVNLKFKDGWEKFCQEHNMEVGDFVVFRHVGDLVFDVLIFDPTACEREFPIPDAPLELMAASSNHPSHLINNNPPEGTISHMRIEEANRIKDNQDSALVNVSKANLVESVAVPSSDKFKGKGKKPDHKAYQCPQRQGSVQKETPQANLAVSDDVIAAVVVEANLVKIVLTGFWTPGFKAFLFEQGAAP